MGWSGGALVLGDIPAERAVFVEPLGRLPARRARPGPVCGPGDMVVVHRCRRDGTPARGRGSAARAHGCWPVEPRADRRELAARLRRRSRRRRRRLERRRDRLDGRSRTRGGDRARSLRLRSRSKRWRSVHRAAAWCCSPDSATPGRAALDLNRLHYLEIALVGSEWIGVPPQTAARALRRCARAPPAKAACRSSELVSDATGLEGVDEAPAGGARAAQPEDDPVSRREPMNTGPLVAADGRLLVVAIDHPLYSWPCHRARGPRNGCCGR